MDPVTLLSIAQTLRSASVRKGLIAMFGLKNTLALIGLGVVGFAAAGWYLGWYGVTATADSQGHSHVAVDVNTAQIEQDIKKGEGVAQKFIEQKSGAVMPVPPPTVPTPNSYNPPLPQAPPLPSGYSYSPQPQYSPSAAQQPSIAPPGYQYTSQTPQMPFSSQSSGSTQMPQLPPAPELPHWPGMQSSTPPASTPPSLPPLPQYPSGPSSQSSNTLPPLPSIPPPPPGDYWAPKN